jgi:hypothetical protein
VLRAKVLEVLSHSPVILAAFFREHREYRQHIMTDSARFFLGSLGYFLLIVLPVLFYLKRRAQTKTRIVLYTFALWFLWYLPYAPIHEGCHFLAGALAGLHVKSYQLIPRFWRGDFVHGYISWEDGKPWQLLLSCQAPYSIDGLIILLGLILFQWRTSLPPFVGALVLTQTFLRSVYDVAVNYAADTILGGSGDFRFLFSGYPRLAIHICAWALMITGALAAVREIKKVQPQKTINSAELERPRK